jgi:hypothetical protein
VHEGVQGGELSHHFRNQVVQFLAVAHAIDQFAVSIAHSGPVHAVHVLVVEIVAMQPPGILESFLEFIAGDHRKGPAFQIHGGIGQRLA